MLERESERENPSHKNSPTALTAQSESCLPPSVSHGVPVEALHSAMEAPDEAHPPPSPPKPHPPDLEKGTGKPKTPSFSEIMISGPSEEVVFTMEIVPLQMPSLPIAVSRENLKLEDEIFVPISSNEYSELVKPWEAAIICKVLGRSFSHDFLRKELMKLWKWEGPME